MEKASIKHGVQASRWTQEQLHDTGNAHDCWYLWYCGLQTSRALYSSLPKNKLTSIVNKSNKFKTNIYGTATLNKYVIKDIFYDVSNELI